MRTLWGRLVPNVALVAQKQNITCITAISYTCKYIYVCIYIYMCVCLCVYVYMYICIHVYVYICVCMYIYICMYIHAYSLGFCTSKYSYLYTYCYFIYIYICSFVSKNQNQKHLARLQILLQHVGTSFQETCSRSIGVIDWPLVEVSPSKSFNVSAMIAVSNWHKPGYRGTV